MQTHCGSVCQCGGLCPLLRQRVRNSPKDSMPVLANGACRYLRDRATKYHIDPCHGHESILQSCLSYISSARIFLNNDALHSLMNEIARTSHGIHRYAWQHWTTHLCQYAQLRHKAALPIGDDIMSQLRSLVWLHKTLPSDAPGTVDSLHRSAYAFRGMPDVAALLSKIFTFLDVEQENRDPCGKSFQSSMKYL